MPAGVLRSVSKGIIENIPLVLYHSSNSEAPTLFKIQESQNRIYLYKPYLYWIILSFNYIHYIIIFYNSECFLISDNAR